MVAVVALALVAFVLPGRAAQALSESATGSSPVHLASSTRPATYPQGPLSDPGGPFLRDASGRAVFLHGVNAVYKYAPFELYPDAGKPWDFSATDASDIARLGFNVVRLGITWAGLEPGTAGPNDPAICTPGAAGDPGQFSSSVADAYLAHVEQTVDLLGEYHIYTLLDMHQDLYSDVFGGEGAPAWAVCTDGFPIVRAPGRWSNTYSTGALDAAFAHFWRNDVVGDLQGQYDKAWATAASYFRSNAWVVGYDPINEPFSQDLTLDGTHNLDTQIECLYTGAAHPGLTSTGAPLSCPAQDPAVGLIPTILAADSRHLVFYESDIFSGGAGVPNYVGAMDYPNLVFNFHDYCPYRNPSTGDPTSETLCDPLVLGTMTHRSNERADLGSAPQPGGPGLFMSEFGATYDASLVSQIVSDANQDMIGWTYWAWKDYDDPTGSSHEGLMSATGQLEPTADALSITYPQAVAGTPESVTDDADGSFNLTYQAEDDITAPTVIFVPVQLHYPHGYCAQATGASIASLPNASYLDVVNHHDARTVVVSVRSGSCAS